MLIRPELKCLIRPELKSSWHQAMANWKKAKADSLTKRQILHELFLGLYKNDVIWLIDTWSITHVSILGQN